MAREITDDLRNRIIWVSEREPQGIVNAVNRGFKVSSGEYINTLSDECECEEKWAFYMLEFLKTHTINVMGAFNVKPFNPFQYFGRIFSPFPFINRKFLKTVFKNENVFLCPEYKSFYADPDLSMRVWAAGGQVIQVKHAVIHHPHIQDEIHKRGHENFHLSDREIFIRIWEQVFGSFTGDP